ncbi:glutaredoxin 2 [Consotaella aegiceratis]|uniref:glutaredoxin 2 n=1 Tax=Consotaella aegiceratis TaxID=3097961 RepID=UPI002F41D0B5
MKLYVYDHCPFCVRARMPFGLKAIPFELHFQLNDDEETPISMIGQKMLPILEDDDGFMGESLDIVHKLDSLSGERIFAGEPSTAITDWISRWGSVMNGLVIPRTPDAVFPEFRTAEARAYFTRKKEAQFGRFDELLAQTDDLIARLRPGLNELEAILPDAEHPSIDDILLFPLLRGLSIVAGLTLPPKATAYRARMAERAGVPLVDDLRAAAAAQ